MMQLKLATGFRLTYTVHLWLVKKRMVDFLVLSLPALTVKVL